MAVRDFLLPDLGEGLEDAEIVAWHVAEGDHVALNQTLVEVNTAKALVEIPAPWEGKVERLHGVQGDVVKVGAPLVSIRVESTEDPEGRGEQGGPAAEGSRPKRRAVLVGYGVEEEEPEALRPPRVAPTAGGPGATEASRPVPASPPVRRLAKELGIELSAIEGTGPGGRVTREDVMRASEGGLSPAQDGQDAQAAPVRPEMGEFDAVPLRGTRRLIAEKMSRSAREIPHVTTFLTVDATSLQAFRCAVPSGQVQDALRELGCSARVISLDPKTIEEIVECIVVVGAATGAEFGTPIINHPEAAILALGVVEPRALVVDGRVEARPAATLSLSFDHRVMDGAEAGRALRALGALVENPFRLGALPR